MLSPQNKQFLRDFVLSFVFCFVVTMLITELVTAIQLRFRGAVKNQQWPSNMVIYTNLNSDPSVGFKHYSEGHGVIVINSNQIIPLSAIR